jgi:hypothetical protein
MNLQDKLNNNYYDIKSYLKIPIKPELSTKFPNIEQIQVYNVRIYDYEKDFKKYQELQRKELGLRDEKNQEFIKDLFDYHFAKDIQIKYSEILNSIYRYARNTGTSYTHIASIFDDMMPIFNVIVKWTNKKRNMP